MATYFISDLHLSANEPQISELFLKFLEEEAKKADALYILGDFFARWIGDDNTDPHDQRITQALANFSETHHQIPIYIMHGNRDFLLGERFIQNSQCILLPDPTVIELYGDTVVLTHGDQLCTLDTSYQRFRRFVRHPWTKKFFLRLPLLIRSKIAQLLSRKASGHPIPQKKPQNFDRRWDVSTDAVYALLRRYKATGLIHGHTHKPNIHHFILDERPTIRAVLGDWGTTAKILVYSPHSVSLKCIS
jgi:UDP-2,3-diacylglucosamine hydrolase